MRYAIYYTPPPSDALHKVAINWLGRDAFIGEMVKRPTLAALSTHEIAQLTQEPARYGFHATLKAPFRLDDAYDESELLSALMHFASLSVPVVIPRLELAALGSFFALVPSTFVPELNQLANDVVVSLDRFRACLRPDDIARRQPERLNELQRHNLHRWGYPYVFDQFRFHMTLTGAVEATRQPQIHRILDEFFAPVLNEPLEISNLALFVEEEPGAPFEIHSLHPMTGGEKMTKAPMRAVGRH